MAEDKAKNDFVQILTSIKRNFEVIHAKWEGDQKSFEAKFRTQIPADNEDFNSLCDEWVDLFSGVTDTVWAKKISNTGPKIRFRKQYQCWTGGGKIIKKELLFDPTRCKGTLDMKVLSDSLQSRRKNRHIKLGLNVVVKINFHHLHQVDTSQPLSFFVHYCLPQQDAPKQNIQPNERLPELVAAMVQNGPIISRRTAAKAEKFMGKLDIENISNSNQLVINYEENALQTIVGQDHINDITENGVEETVHQNLEPVKFDILRNNERCTQFVVNSLNTSNQIEVGEQLLMYPLVFEVPQLISLTTQNIAPQFIHILPKSDEQNQNLM